MTKKQILITGASGFLGQFCAQSIQSHGVYNIRLATRSIQQLKHLMDQFEVVQVANLSSNTDWNDALHDCYCVIHAAGHVHKTKKHEQSALSEFRRINVEGSIQLAKQAVLSGVKRFIYISSIKVNGEASLEGIPFHADDVANPKDAYSLSKYEAEVALKKLVAPTAMELVIIRPPLVYGPGVKGNFKSMLRWLQKGYPVPMTKTENRRSFVGLSNLTDFIETCIEHPKATNEVFLVSDGCDLSTAELLRWIGTIMNKDARLFYVPHQGLILLLKLFRKESVLDRLYASLQVDIEKNSKILGWTPKYSIKEMLKETIEDFLQSNT